VRRLTLAAAVLYLIGVPSAEVAQFVARVDLVRVDVLATHRGRPIPGLAIEDFQLLDNGVPQTLTSVEMEQVPLGVILAFDTSASMQGEPLRHLTQAGLALVDRLGDGDRAALLAFSEELVLAAPLTADLDVVRAGLSRTAALGATSLFDAIHAALTLRDAALDRTVLIVFTDGLDSTSWLTGVDVLERARASDVVVYAVTLADTRADSLSVRAWPSLGFVSPPAAAEREEGEPLEFLERLADETGGQVIRVSSSRRLSPAFGRILDELKTRYVLTYSPEGVTRDGWHRLEVSLTRRPGEIIARRGYYAGTSRG
jgi:Ca-activated chloride channel homolog